MAGVLLIMIPIYCLMLLTPIALLIALQIWLCRRGPRLGLILPALTLALSLLLTLSVAAFGVMEGGVTRHGVTLYDEYGQIIEQEIYSAVPEQTQPIHSNAVILAAVIFLVGNIPTLVFGGIWLHFKNRQEWKNDLHRMQIEDLE